MILRYSTSPAPKPSTTISFAEIKARLTQNNETMTTLEIQFPAADLADLTPIIETIARCRSETPAINRPDRPEKIAGPSGRLSHAVICPPAFS